MTATYLRHEDVIAGLIVLISQKMWSYSFDKITILILSDNLKPFNYLELKAVLSSTTLLCYRVLIPNVSLKLSHMHGHPISENMKMTLKRARK
jgi:hypothetical protein